jgi:hypothetical protein
MELFDVVLFLVAIGFLFAVRELNRFVARLNGEYDPPSLRRWRRIGTILGFLFFAALFTADAGVNSGRPISPIEVILRTSVVLLLGITLFWVTYRGLREADELVRKLELETLVLTFAGALLGIVSLTILSNAEIVSEVRVRDILYLTLFPYVASRLLTAWRYRG